MKKVYFLILVILFSLNFVSALSIQEQISNNQATYMQQNGGKPLAPIDIIKIALVSNAEFRTEFIKSILIIMVIMSLTIVDAILKGFAMWKASKNNSKLWFWLLLLISSLGILPLCYLIFAKKEHKKEVNKKK